MPPVIALLSDFGTRDHYAGTMKGVILGICPEAVLVDLTHDIPPHDVLQGALQLAASCRYFPPGTIFLAVVDPGVGSARRGIAVDAGDYRFVAPDNGLLTAVLARRDAAQRRRAHRAALRAPDREPDVRGARPLRAGRGVARPGRAAGARSVPRCPTTSGSTSRCRRSTRTGCAARSCSSIGSATS